MRADGEPDLGCVPEAAVTVEPRREQEPIREPSPEVQPEKVPA